MVEQFLEHVWQWEERATAFALMQTFASTLAQQGSNEPLRARCHLKLGQWQQLQHPTSFWDERQRGPILENLKQATELDPRNSKAWHFWALLNQRVARHYTKDKHTSQQHINHLANAVHAFFQSVDWSSSPSVDLDILQQDILRILTIWFEYGHEEQVERELRKGFNTVNIDTWLLVIPQIIARIHATQPVVREMIYEVLCRIGKAHPQALIYPLTVATNKSNIPARKAASQNIVENMKQHSENLVRQVLTCAYMRLHALTSANECVHVRTCAHRPSSCPASSSASLSCGPSSGTRPWRRPAACTSGSTMWRAC